ncbi:MAG: hypothetical protein LBE57_04720 [Methanosarcinales archaeon]|jgi:hypothetical protein|nr:hypothetical protein [Methanosarcinales archaeon]
MAAETLSDFIDLPADHPCVMMHVRFDGSDKFNHTVIIGPEMRLSGSGRHEYADALKCATYKKDNTIFITTKQDSWTEYKLSCLF